MSKTKKVEIKKASESKVKKDTVKKPEIEKTPEPIKVQPKEIVEEKVEVKTPKVFGTLGRSGVKIVRIEKITVNRKEENRIYLEDGSITVLNNEDLDSQLDQ